jgi:hypothetical protein
MPRLRTAFVCALAALIVSTALVRADVRTEERNLVKFEGMLGRMAGMFGGKAAREGVKTTTAVKGDRKLTMTDQTGQIVDLAEEKVYDLDIRRKTYTVTTFAAMRQRMEEAQKKAAAETRKMQEQQKEAAPPPKDPNAKEMEVDFDLKETGAKKTINGFDTRQVVMTIAMREKGKTLEESGGLVLTSDMWLGPKVDAIKEIAQFDIRYAKQIAGPMVAGASPEEMAAAMALYPGMQNALGRMRQENVKLEGTPILTTMIIEAAKSAAQLAQEKQAAEQSSSSSGGGGISGAIGGFARRAVTKKEEPKPRATIMTTTSEVMKVTTDVPATDVAIPAGFKEAK